VIGVIQRVSYGSVTVDERVIGEIGRGIVILLGVARGDSLDDLEYLADKIINLRIFEDDYGKMNLSLADIGGEVLVISQFTLLADLRKGRRPGFDLAEDPKLAAGLYNRLIENLKGKGLRVAEGSFGARMLVRIDNDGPVTFILDSRDKKAKT
jgi:D-tyrosyl-tRNA(Tyr) deacylase